MFARRFPDEEGLGVSTGLGDAWTRTDQVKRSGVDGAFQGSTALAKPTMRQSDDPSSEAHGRPGERRHVELPAAPVGLGTRLSNQLHTSSDQTSFDLAKECAISQPAKVGQSLRESR